MLKGVKLGVGPVIENGFYYDIDSPEPITADDLLAIEKEMKKIINENIEIVRHDVSRAEAFEKFKEDEYKIELLEAIAEDDQISIYEQGDFFDLCRGVHVPSTGKLKEFKFEPDKFHKWQDFPKIVEEVVKYGNILKKL